MKYRIVDENGEVICEFGMGEKLLPQLVERLMGIHTLADIAKYTPVQITLLEQLQLLYLQSSDCTISAANAEAMCRIAETLKELKC